ncbi:TPA: DUF3383 domain-containing protein [Serratia marcescens]|uniref:DUF3383 domain-containing protein n=1 Tax=Serratia ureilytica TaxID=300181 RepID=A0A9X9BYP5_9GAMM|nr:MULTISPECIES: DUF3383 family protein [Serratia]MBS3894702.1 DUF3383 domain-containing protein [Serratia marcescens]TXE25882.1 DUF3383 domain-containing protein [Serratia ureilytica]HBC7422519.1 DUF3383 domain-containing protein [Serratia marcescens]
MNKIPLSRDFRIKPGVVNAAGTALDMCGLLLSDSDLLPAGQVLAFTGADAVLTYFGADSDEYRAATIYFPGYSNSTVTPATLLMARCVTDVAGAAGWCRSGSFKGVTLDTLKLVNGTVTLDIDGTSVTSAAIDLSTATSFSSAATIIQTAIGAKVTVIWLPVQQCFVITSKIIGAESAVGLASGSAADGLKLTANTGAMTSVGVEQSDIPLLMNKIINISQDWVLFTTTFTPDEKTHIACGQWVSQTDYRFGYVMHDDSQAAITPSSEDCLAFKVTVLENCENVMPVYGDYRHAMTALAYMASLDFNRLNGRVSYKYRDFTGVAPNVNDGDTADALKSNGYSFFGVYGANRVVKNYTADGAISGKFLWLDSFVSQVWINANLLGGFAELFTQNESYPFSAAGYAAIQTAVIDVAGRAKDFGAIRAGVTLDKAQIKVVNDAVGRDISSTLFSDGWFMYIPDQSGSSRTERHLDGAIFYYVDGQLIQSIAMSSTDIL